MLPAIKNLELGARLLSVRRWRSRRAKVGWPSSKSFLGLVRGLAILGMSIHMAKPQLERLRSVLSASKFKQARTLKSDGDGNLRQGGTVFSLYHCVSTTTSVLFPCPLFINDSTINMERWELWLREALCKAFKVRNSDPFSAWATATVF